MPHFFQTILVIVCFTVAGGVILPGRCPIVPASHRFPNKNISDVNILRQVPFAKNTSSYLFHEMSPILLPGFVASFFNGDSVMLSFLYQDSPLGDSYALASAHMNSESITLNSTVYVRNITNFNVQYIPMDCHKPIVEEVRLWQDGGFVIIWSCVNSFDGNHDEAVMMIEWGRAFYSDYNVFPHTSENLLKSLKRTSQTYLSEPLLKQIDWSMFEYNGHPQSQTPPSRPFECSRKKLIDDFMVLSFIVICVLFALVIGLLLWKSFKNKE